MRITVQKVVLPKRRKCKRMVQGSGNFKGRFVMLTLLKMAIVVISFDVVLQVGLSRKQRVPKRFLGIQDFPYLRLGIRD